MTNLTSRLALTQGQLNPLFSNYTQKFSTVVSNPGEKCNVIYMASRNAVLPYLNTASQMPLQSQFPFSACHLGLMSATLELSLCSTPGIKCVKRKALAIVVDLKGSNNCMAKVAVFELLNKVLRRRQEPSPLL